MKLQTKTIAILVAVWLLVAATATAQVTIGADSVPNSFSVLELVSNKAGLRLPQLNNAQRNAIASASSPANVPPAGKGLVIFNTESNCIEYWNSERWISLCEGSAQIDLVEDPDPDGVEAEGGFAETEGTGEDLFMVEDNDPEAPDGPFNFTVTTGNDYAELLEEDEVDGFFSLYFKPNNSTKQRSAIVRVTNIITGRYKDFLFTQKGMGCSTTVGTAPAITSLPAAQERKVSFFAEGAVYLWVPANTPKLDSLIWTRNGAEIARGLSSIIVTQPGTYDIYMGAVGCNAVQGNAVTVTRCDAVAPHAVSIVVTGNNGKVCSSNGEVTLVARTTGSSSETVSWFQNGVLQPGKTGKTITAGIGTWFAVVGDNRTGTNPDCVSSVGYSVPSEAVTVFQDLDATGGNALASLTQSDVDLDGSFCEGSTKMLSVKSPVAGVTYTWYADNTEIATGDTVIYAVPSGVQNVIIRCRATKPNSCAVEFLSSEITINAGNSIPAMPSIMGDKALCDGEAMLSIVTSSTVSSYAWYKDGKRISTDQYLDITEGGDYYAAYSSGGCFSPMAHINIPLESSVTPEIGVTPVITNSKIGNTITYTASAVYGEVKDYKWTVPATGVTVVSGGGASDRITVKFEAATGTGTADITVVGSNDCGDGDMVILAVTVTGNCDATVNSVTPSTKTSVTTMVNSPVMLGKVSATLSDKSAEESYQWFSVTSETNSGGSAITGATKKTYMASQATEGIYYYYCEVSTCTGSSTKASGVYVVNVIKEIPASTPMGAGIFTGRTSFDINYTDGGDACGTKASRESKKTDFTIRTPQDPEGSSPVTAPYSGVQVYTFTAASTETATGVVFSCKDPEAAIDSIVPNGNKLTVYYKASLQNTLKGKTRNNAIKPMLYVMYNDGTKNVMLQLTIYLQDCAYCGANTDQGGFLSFMCYNLGAGDRSDPLNAGGKLKPFDGIGGDYIKTITLDKYEAERIGSLIRLDFFGVPLVDIGKHFEYLDIGPIHLGEHFKSLKKLGQIVNKFNPFAQQEEEDAGYMIDRSKSNMGDLYQWGRRGDGHQIFGEEKITKQQASSTKPSHDKFIKMEDGRDWYDNTGNDKELRWGNGTDAVNVKKAANDPCPQGWKVPSKAQWQSILGTSSEITPNQTNTPNKWTWKESGYMIGNALFLPAANYRGTKSGLYESGMNGVMGGYWSSTFVSDKAFAVSFTKDKIKVDDNTAMAKDDKGNNKPLYPGDGLSVRCVSE